MNKLKIKYKYENIEYTCLLYNTNSNIEYK